VIDRWLRRAAEVLDRRLEPLNARLGALEAQIASQQRSLDTVAELAPVLRTLAADDPGHRRRLAALRAGPDYALAWDEPDPLVTISIPTRSRPRLLVERALASALAQTHEQLEVLVVGDAAGPEIAAAVDGVGDPRVRYLNLTHQFVRDDGKHWLTAATLTRNEAYRLARGRWLVDLDDDDALRPSAIADLLEQARADRLEAVYGVLEEHEPGGATNLLGGFPPMARQFGWQGAVVHAGLRFFEREFVAADLGMSGDWFRLQRMLRAGVRIGHLDQVTGDYYPSTLWGAGD
jgi:glycosyltransferase involved in cell wall biosynthesis